MFKDILRSDESLFRDDTPLDFVYEPKLIQHREKEQRQIASCIRPLVQKRNGRNIFIYGKPGIGKTVSVTNLFKALDEEDGVEDEAYHFMVNCWHRNTSFKVIVQICSELGYKFTQNKKTEELFRIAANILNRRSAVFAFDEIDKAEDLDFLYTILEQIYRKTVILITNHRDWILGIEERIKSRLSPEMLPFEPYTRSQVHDILESRKKLAFNEGVWEPPAFEKVVARTYQYEDIRAGLNLMKEAGQRAEDESSRKIAVRHVELAAAKMGEYSVNDATELDDEARFVLGIVKKHSGRKIGDIYRAYQAEGGQGSYKTFQRKIQRLADGKFASVKKITGGSEGSTTLVDYLRTKKLTEF